MRAIDQNGIGPEIVSAGVKNLRLLTYNIRKGYGASGRSRTAFNDMRSALAKRRDDVVLLQEVCTGVLKWL